MRSVVDRYVIKRRKPITACGKYTVKSASKSNIFTVVEQW